MTLSRPFHSTITINMHCFANMYNLFNSILFLVLMKENTLDIFIELSVQMSFICSHCQETNAKIDQNVYLTYQRFNSSCESDSAYFYRIK